MTLWTALHYPRLPIECRGGIDEGRPRAVAVRHGARRFVLLRDAAADALGVRPGQRVADALALAPALRVDDIDERARAALLGQLTLQALDYSSRVTPHPPDTLLVEVRGSLRLFGGLDALLGRMRSDAGAQGVTLRLGTAPTPAAAALLARAGHDAPVRSGRLLDAALADIALEHLGLDGHVLAGLRRSGVRRLGELRALEPAALTRRFGHALTNRLYRLDGRLPDPQTAFAPPPTFAEATDLPLEADGTAALAFVLRRLLGALGGFLRGRDLGVRALELRLFHRRRAPTPVTLRLAEATSDTLHLQRVVTERLDGTRLLAPVTRLALEAAELAEVRRAAPVLLGGGPLGDGFSGAGRGESIPVAAVADRLVARLGERAVYSARTGDDHRPEKASSAVPPDFPGAPPARLRRGCGAGTDADEPDGARAGRWEGARSPRPLWLLREPRLASESLVLGPDPERIENGWWEAGDVRRDYFIARDGRGTHYWVFRSRHDPRTLWIHGLFA